MPLDNDALAKLRQLAILYSSYNDYRSYVNFVDQ